jgi:uncharacterized membrane protein YkvA (DUF1232 family)
MEANDVSRALVPVPGQEEKVRRRFWGKVRRTLGRVPFLDQAVAAYYAAVDPATPPSAKAVLFASLTYFVIPADLIPDPLPSGGFADDLAVLFAAIQMIGPHITVWHRDRARDFLRGYR